MKTHFFPLTDYPNSTKSQIKSTLINIDGFTNVRHSGNTKGFYANK